jgi:hypothetical protein
MGYGYDAGVTGVGGVGSEVGRGEWATGHTGNKNGERLDHKDKRCEVLFFSRA